MSKAAPQALFAFVESFFTKYLPRQRGASPHTIRAYRDALKLLLTFAADRRGCQIAALQLEHLNADVVACFLDHTEAERSNSAATRNCRRAAIRGFFKHLVRNDLDHALQYTRVLALPAKKARQRPATYLEAADLRAVIANPDRRTASGWRDYTLLLFLYNSGARVSETIGVRWCATCPASWRRSPPPLSNGRHLKSQQINKFHRQYAASLAAAGKVGKDNWRRIARNGIVGI